MRVVRVAGALLHVEETGARTDAASLVLVHALGTDLRLWRPLLERWRAPPHVIRFDLRGHGLSSCPSAPWTIEDLVDDAAGLLDALELERTVVVGASLGGLVAQGLAARRPELVRAMVLSGSAARMGTPALWADRIARIERDGLPALSDAILDRWFAPDRHAPDERLGWRRLLERTPPAGYVAACGVIAGTDLTESTRTLTLPTLAVAGGLDLACTPEEVERTAALVPGARFVRLDEAAHLPCVDAPEAFLGLLRAFLDEVSDG